MPSELRQILFRPPEVVQAIREYQRRMRSPLPSGNITQCVTESDATGLRVRLIIALDDPASSTANGGEREIVVAEPTLAAALILHCRDRRTPLPASAEKSLRRFGDQLGLVLTVGG